MRHCLVNVLGCAALIASGAIGVSASEISATHRLPNPVGGTFAIPIGRSNSGVRVAQTFTAEIGGILQSISVAAVCTDRTPTPLFVAVTEFANGQPGATLASSPLSGLGLNGQFPDIKTLNATADLSDDSLVLKPHQQYALLFIPENTSASFQVLGDQTVGASRDYIGGEILRSLQGAPFEFMPGGDLVFQVDVEAVPEASSFLMALSAAVALCGARCLARQSRYR